MRMTQPLGLRYYSVDANKGFFLNGESYPLHGVAVIRIDPARAGQSVTQTRMRTRT